MTLRTVILSGVLVLGLLLANSADWNRTAHASRYLEDHHGDTMAEATELQFGTRAFASNRVTAVIYPPDDVDFFRLTVTEAEAGLSPSR